MSSSTRVGNRVGRWSHPAPPQREAVAPASSPPRVPRSATDTAKRERAGDHTKERSADMPTADEVADVLEDACDYLIVNGWCQGAAQLPTGERCALGALVYGTDDYLPAWKLIRSFVEGEGFETIPDWNNAPERTIDDVLDLFRCTAKALRNGELEVA